MTDPAVEPECEDDLADFLTSLPSRPSSAVYVNGSPAMADEDAPFDADTARRLVRALRRAR